jgi:DNA repair exonuclease SbcCD ATPase subunit
LEVKLKLRQINEVDKFLEKKKEINKKIEEKRIFYVEKNKKLTEESEKIKKSEEYLKNLNKKEKVNMRVRELEKNIYSLKAIINFKALGNIFHSDKNKMNIIKLSRDNFHDFFKKNKITPLLNLILESKLNNQKILEGFKKIENLNKEILEIKSSIKFDLISPSKEEIQKINFEIKNLETEKDNNLKLSEKLKIKKQDLINLIKKEVEGLGIKLN